MNSLVDITTLDPTIRLDIRYATADNFLEVPLYARAKCFLHSDVAKALVKVQAKAKEMNLGLLIWDGYRPKSVQQKMWDKLPDERYVSNPAKGGRHTRGTAVDLTLVDQDGNQLEMPTEFDDFTEKAHSDSEDCSPEAKINRAVLKTLMAQEGFTQLRTEWWHFDFQGWDSGRYPVLDLTFEELSF